MSFYIDKHNRRKSPIALAAFGAALLDICVFGALSFLLAEPLYHAVSFDSAAATAAVHSTLIALLGTAVCCLLFLLKDKRVVPYGFAGLAVVLCLFYGAALALDAEVRTGMLGLISMFGLAPVLVGNAVSWPVYLKMKRANPALNHRKTIQEELREAVDKEAAKQARRAPAQAAPAERASAPAAPAPASKTMPEPALEEDALFGPEAGHAPPSGPSLQEEAMLFYEDDETDDD